MAPTGLIINDLPEEALCHILSHVDFSSKYTAQRVCKRWYQLLTYPPQGSGVWGTLPLNLMKLHDTNVRSLDLEWLAARAAGINGLFVRATSAAPPPPLGCPHGRVRQLTGSLPFRLTTTRFFAGFSLARILGMLSVWLQRIDVRLSGSTFEHRSFDLLTDSTQPWLVAAMRDIRFDANMVGADAKFPQLCALTQLTRLEVTAIPCLPHSRGPALLSVPPSLSRLSRLHTLRLDLHADSKGLPAEASTLRELRVLYVSAGAKFNPDVLATLTVLQELSVSLGKRRAPPAPARMDQERLVKALAPLTRLTRLSLTACGLPGVPAEVLGMRRLAELVLSGNLFHPRRAGGALPSGGSGVGAAAIAAAAAAADPGGSPVDLHAALTALQAAGGAGGAGAARADAPPRAMHAGRGRNTPGGPAAGARAAETDGHKWWADDAAAALTALSSLSLAGCGIRSLPQQLAHLPALAALHLQHNSLGQDRRETPVPTLPLLRTLDISFNGYERLPPGLLTLTALSRLRFLDTTARVLPPLEPLLELPRLQEVALMRDEAHRSSGAGNAASVIRLGAFEAKFIAARQARGTVAELPAPSGQAALPERAAKRSAFSRLGAVEEMHLHLDGSSGGYGMDPFGVVGAPGYFPGLVPGMGDFPGPPPGYIDYGDDEDEEEDAHDQEEDDDGFDDAEDEAMWDEEDAAMHDDWPPNGHPEFWFDPNDFGHH